MAKIEFDTNVITYEQILNVFWQAHDPTTLNRQGNDIGTQYRSVIYYHNEKQKEIAINSKKKQISLVTGMIRSLQKFPKYIIILMLRTIIMTITRITLISPIVYLLSSLNWTN